MSKKEGCNMKKAKTNFWTKVYPWILPVAIIVFWQIAVQTKLINSQLAMI